MRRAHPPLALLAFAVAVGVPVLASTQSARVEDEPRVSARVIHRLTQDLEAVVRERGLPGLAVAVVHRDGALLTRGFGYADREGRRPMDAQTLMYAGSLTKPVTAIAVLKLRDEGRLSLDDPVNRYVPGFRTSSDAAPTVTVRHLLTHTSGLPREGSFDYWFSGRFPNGAGLRGEVAGASLRSAPGSRWHYSNIGYALLGQVVASASGVPFETYLVTEVLSPLRMRRSGAVGPPSDRGALATGYTPTSGPLPNAERPFFGIGRALPDGRRVRAYHDANAMAPAFGMYTTVEDLGCLAQTLLGGGPPGVTDVLAPHSRREMLRPSHTFEAPGTGWSYGLRVTRQNDMRVLRHDGWFAAHRSHMLLAPGSGLGVVVMINADDTSPRDVAADVLRTLTRGNAAPP